MTDTVAIETSRRRMGLSVCACCCFQLVGSLTYHWYRYFNELAYWHCTQTKQISDALIQVKSENKVMHATAPSNLISVRHQAAS